MKLVASLTETNTTTTINTVEKTLNQNEFTLILNGILVGALKNQTNFAKNIRHLDFFVLMPILIYL